MEMNNEYYTLESIHCAIQELQQEYNISHNNEHLLLAFELVETLREQHLVDSRKGGIR